MEPIGHTLRQQHPGNRRRAEITGLQQHHLATPFGFVVHKGDEPAVVLGLASRTRYEDPFSAQLAPAVRMVLVR